MEHAGSETVRIVNYCKTGATVAPPRATSTDPSYGSGCASTRRRYAAVAERPLPYWLFSLNV